MAQYVLAPSDTGRNHRRLKLKQEMLAGHFWAGSAAGDSSEHLSVPSIQGAKLALQNESQDSWQAGRKREIPLAEKIQKRELNKFTFYSNFIVVKRTGSAQGWESDWVQGSDSGSKRCSAHSTAPLGASSLGFPATFHIPWLHHHLALFVCLDLGWSKL